MLKPPYTEYSRIYTYHIDGTDLPEFDDPDLVGSWIEDNKTIAVFHKPKENLINKLCEAHGCDLFWSPRLATQRP